MKKFKNKYYISINYVKDNLSNSLKSKKFIKMYQNKMSNTPFNSSKKHIIIYKNLLFLQLLKLII